MWFGFAWCMDWLVANVDPKTFGKTTGWVVASLIRWGYIVWLGRRTIWYPRRPTTTIAFVIALMALDRRSADADASFLFWSGVLLLATTLFQASAGQGLPLSQLGVRPHGRGLFTYLGHYLSSEGKVGVLGYDPIQGALSPPLRLMCHASAILMTWGILIILSRRGIAEEEGNPSTSTPTTTVTACAGLLSIALYLDLFHFLYAVLPGVSVPSGPREHKIQRTPAWANTQWTIDALFPNNNTKKQGRTPQWRFATGSDAHAVSEETFAGTSAALTGEAAGRDIWTTSSSATTTKNNSSSRVEEALVQEMASGGRPPGFNPHVNPNCSDQPFRAQMIREYLSSGKKPPSLAPVKTVTEAIHKGVHFYSMLQTEDGHWSGDYGGPHFLLPGLIVVWYCMGKPQTVFTQDDMDLMISYITTHQQLDGGWGTHVESPSTMFGTTLMYVSLRLLGITADHPMAVRGQKFILDQGGALMTSSWAKFYLCLLGAMEWEGHNSVPPEMWLLPRWFPFHPGRMWCHARMVYLPMGFIYGSRYVFSRAESDPVVQALREELYCEPYESIPWTNTRHMVAPMDNYSPIPLVMVIAQNALAVYENGSIFKPFRDAIRKRGLSFCVDYMAAEDMQTNFIDIGPVNKVLNMLSAFVVSGEDIAHPTVSNHLIRVADYMWVAEDGMKMKGYNGSQCWDTSFAIQGIFEAGLLDEFPDVSKRVWKYLERCQILSTETSQSTISFHFETAENRQRYFRHLSQGGWPFSTSAHGWPISDCTGEGLKGVLCLLKSKAVEKALLQGELKPISQERIESAVNVLLSYQNEDGGFATYENCRGFGWYESLNPSEVFGDIMIDYSYVECSMASLTALVEFNEIYPLYREADVRHSIEKGRDFLKSLQRLDGSWYGNWACCFCYGCWFGVEGLLKCGEPRESESIESACRYLLMHQRSNGGWGEDFTSCYNKEYAEDGMKAYGDCGSGVVNTSWALLALSAAQSQETDAIKRGVSFLKKRQLPCGDWPQEGIAGVFNRACGITYTAYRNVFPIWALARCHAVYGAELDASVNS